MEKLWVILTPERFLFHAVMLHHHFTIPWTLLVEHLVIALTSFTALLHSGHWKIAPVLWFGRSTHP